MNFNSQEQYQMFSVIENPTVNSLRMPRAHELHYNISSECNNQSENKFEQNNQYLQCIQCQRTFISDDLYSQDLLTCDQLCNCCSIDLLAEETVKSVFKNIYLNESGKECKIFSYGLGLELGNNKYTLQENGNENQVMEVHTNNFQKDDCHFQQNEGNSELNEKKVLDDKNDQFSEKSNNLIKINNISKTNTRMNSNEKRNSDITESISKSKSSESPLVINTNSELIPTRKPRFEYSKSEPFPKQDSEERIGVKIHNGFQLAHFYVEEENVGNGKFGKVSKVYHRETKEICAVKTIIYRNEETKKNILNEIEILESLQGNDHILKLIEVIDNDLSRPKAMHIITEYLGGGELYDQIAQDDLLTEEQIISIMQQILNGLSFIHGHGIIHRDIKPENLVYTSEECGHIKIIDFGFAVKFNDKNPPKSMVGTTVFVAPEVLRYEAQSYSTDMWSAGVVAFNLLVGITPFEIPMTGDIGRQLTDREIIENIERCQYDFNDEGFSDVSDDAKDFISKLLIRNPSKRMTANECLNHSWLLSSYRKKPRKGSRSISIQRMKNYVAIHKWQKVAMAIHTINNFKSYILYKS